MAGQAQEQELTASKRILAAPLVITFAGWLLGALSAGTGWADTLRVEKDGSGDFTIIQDALDAAAPGDSILIGPGRFDDFQLHDLAGGRGTWALIMLVQSGPLTIIGAGSDQTIIGPENLVVDFMGHPTYGLKQDVPAPTIYVEGVGFENSQRAVGLEGTARFRDCSFVRCDEYLVVMYPQTIDGLRFENCEFLGLSEAPRRCDGITTFVGGQTPNLQVTGTSFRYTSGGIQAYGCDDCLIEGSVFEDVWVPLSFHGGGSPAVDSVRIVRPGNLALVIHDGVQVELTGSYLGSGAFRTVRLYSGSSLTGSSSVIGGGQFDSILTCANCVVEITNSDILNGGTGPTIVNETRAETQAVLDFTNNYWGTTDSTQIAEWIVEGENPFNLPLAEIDFVPFRSQSVPTQKRSFSQIKALFGQGEQH